MSNVLKKLHQVFPLYQYQDEAETRLNGATTGTSLWVAPHHLESTFWSIRLSLLNIPHTSLQVNSHDAGPGGELPALHLTDGTLLATHEIEGWLQKQQEQSVEGQADVEAWTALFHDTLAPAWVSDHKELYILMLMRRNRLQPCIQSRRFRDLPGLHLSLPPDLSFLDKCSIY